MDDRSDILATALDWARRGKSVALATVVATWGSSPRGVGSLLAIDQDGRFIGSVSGGCVEGEILATAEEVLATGKPVLREFGVSNERAWSVGLACGGAIKIFVERIGQIEFLQGLIDDARAGHESRTVLALETGARRPYDPAAPLDLSHGGLVETSLGLFFLEHWRAPLRLAIIGAVHIAQALAPIAALAGYDVTVIDPRGAFADPARFPGVKLRPAWPQDALSDYRLDARAALVALSHEPRIDDPALAAALDSACFYIGALGSRGSAEKRRVRLRASGYSDAALARIHGPIGLPIGAATPAEIAIAIAAEMTEALRIAPLAALGRAAE
jgi:xanthine dehydrogenase accessory factor